VTKDPSQALPVFLGALAEASTSYKNPYENPYENSYKNKDLR
jgi:hypothetical protein